MNFVTLDRRWYELIILIGLAVITTPIFWLTDIDQQVAAWFYEPLTTPPENDHWPMRHWWLWTLLFDYAKAVIVGGALLVLIIAIFASRLPKYTRLKRPALYIFLVIALGPGLVVNIIFKDHWGRPRPVHMHQLSGQHDYVPPLKIGSTHEKSFVCGHCSVGFAFFVFYFLSKKHKTRYFLLTLLLSLALGLARMSAGGHFISDILWSGYSVFLVAWLVYYGWYQRQPN